MANVNEAGFTDDYTLNGASLELSRSLEARFTRRETLSDTMSGRKRVHRAYDGAGLPDVQDSAEFALEWDLDDNYSATIAQIEKARAGKGPHSFIWWKKRYARYTAAAGQAVFYLPRQDAYNSAISGHTDAGDKAVITVNGTAVTVVYGTVTSATTVTTGEVWISTTTTTHPDTGETVTLFKFGDALSVNDDVLVEFYPVYQVQISDASDRFELVGREDKSVVFVEAE